MGSLSDIQLRSWVRAGKSVAGISDGDGLTFTLSAKGTASWILRYRIAGKAKELTIGRYPDISLMDARKIAAAKRVEVQQVIDVAAVKQRRKFDAKASINVEHLSELWLDHSVRPRHQNPQVTERVFKRDILPALGRFDTKSVTMPDITRLLAKINSSGRPSIANDALRYLKAMFAYGEALGAVDKNPAERIKIAHAGGSEKPRTRALSRNELAKLFESITESRIRFGRENELAIKLLLALGCRKMELFASTWSEFDFDRKIWRISATRVKTRESRELPLAAPVIEWLTELRSIARMKAGCTKRPSIHKTILLRDVATVYAKHMNSCARKELKKINGYREERRVGKNYIQTPVEIYARALFKSIGHPHPQTFRRLAKEALQYL